MILRYLLRHAAAFISVSTPQEHLKRVVTAIHANPQQLGQPLPTMANPAAKLTIVTNQHRLAKPQARAEKLRAGMAD